MLRVRNGQSPCEAVVIAKRNHPFLLARFHAFVPRLIHQSFTLPYKSLQ
jgi:hypothetical protein